MGNLLSTQQAPNDNNDENTIKHEEDHPTIEKLEQQIKEKQLQSEEQNTLINQLQLQLKELEQHYQQELSSSSTSTPTKQQQQKSKKRARSEENEDDDNEDDDESENDNDDSEEEVEVEDDDDDDDDEGSSRNKAKRAKMMEKHDQKIFITFSGFKNDADYYSKNLKKKIVFLLNELKLNDHVILLSDNESDREALPDRTTHIITTPFAKTMKVLQAVVSNRWIMSPEWLLQLELFLSLIREEQQKQQQQQESIWRENIPKMMEILFSSQEQFGFRSRNNFLNGKSVFLMQSFVKSYRDTVTWKHCRVLVRYAGGQFVEQVDEADFCLTTTNMNLNGQNGGNSSNNNNNNSVLLNNSSVTANGGGSGVGSSVGACDDSSLMNQMGVGTNSTTSQQQEAELALIPPYCHICTWGQFIDLIYPPYYETGLCKGRSILVSMMDQEHE